MTTRLAALALTGVTLLAGALPSSAQTPEDMDRRLDTLFGEHEIYAEFLATLQEAVGASNGDAVADLVAYPVTTTVSGQSVTFTDAMSFSNRYDEILTPAIVEAVEDQTYETLFANDLGIMIGAGEVWFGGVCRDAQCATVDVRVIAINPPTPAR